MVQATKVEFFKLWEDRPTATIHAALVAVQYSKETSLEGMVKYLKGSGFVTSDSALYGYKGRSGVFEAAESLKLVTKAEGTYKLTEKGKAIVDARTLADKEHNSGSDLHRQLLIKTIEHLHTQNMMVDVPDSQDAPDLIAYPVEVVY